MREGPLTYERREGEDAGTRDAPVPSLEAIERRRRGLWLTTAFFLLAASASVALSLTEVAGTSVPDIPALRWGLLVLALAFMLYVFDQERLLRGLTRAFMAHDVQTTTLEARIGDLTTLTRVGRAVNSVLTIEEVVATVLDAASELTRARNGSVMLREDEQLRVRASRGPEAAPTGVAVPIGEGLAGEVAGSRRPLLITGRLRDDERADGRAEERPFGSSVVVPLVATDELVGVLSLERPHDDDAFTELDLRSVALFAEHAGVAIANALRFEGERDTAARLTEVLELRSEFVAALVHDLKNPITAILGFTSLMSRAPARMTEADRAHALGAVAEEGERLLQMVEELLYSTSVDAGAQLHRAPVELGDLLGPVVEAAASGAAAREGADRPIGLVADGPRQVQGDPQALRHVFMNLVDNAVKYSPSGSRVAVRMWGEEGNVVVEVVDRGEGIAPDELPNVFERFRQGEGRTRHGVGLGLYIARTLVTAHGGRIGVDSTLGEGTTFRVELPMLLEEDQSAPEPAVAAG